MEKKNIDWSELGFSYLKTDYRYLKEGLEVEAGMKCGDIDGRCQVSHCFSISDKARAIGGGVLEAVLYGGKEKGYVSIHCKREAVPE